MPNPKVAPARCDVCARAMNRVSDLTPMYKRGAPNDSWVTMAICAARGCWQKANENEYYASSQRPPAANWVRTRGSRRDGDPDPGVAELEKEPWSWDHPDTEAVLRLSQHLLSDRPGLDVSKARFVRRPWVPNSAMPIRSCAGS